MCAAENVAVHPVLEGIVGVSDWTRHIHRAIPEVAAFPSNVIITGQTGTGKELISRAIHTLSPRSRHRFVPVDCAAVTGPLFTSHIFGHVKGAFTGATYSAAGCFRAADGGTIFFDEIGELDFTLQAKLLRVLQERVVVPVGSQDQIPVDVRVIAATNRDLRQEVAAGRFREDLYWRLNVVTIRTLPLRVRPEDIQVLARHFLAKFSVAHGLTPKRLSPAAIGRMHGYDWPGNVRQLENVLERAMLFSPGELIGPENIVRAAEDMAPAAPAAAQALMPAAEPIGPGDVETDQWPTAEEVEREHIRGTLEHTCYNQSAAAELLGMDRHKLRRRIKKYGLEPPVSKAGRPRKPR